MSKEIMRTLGVAAQTRNGEPGTPITFDLSTPGRKRDGIRLDLTRMRTTNFESNPVALWMHGKDIAGGVPVGKWRSIAMRGNGDDARLEGELVFDQEDDFARTIERKYRDGFLNAVSIMWNTTRNDNGEVEFDLLEAGPVPIPADPEALIRAGEAAVNEYRAVVRELADALDRSAGVAISTVEEFHNTNTTFPLQGDFDATSTTETEPRTLHDVPAFLSRGMHPLSLPDLFTKLSSAVNERYGTMPDAPYYAAAVFAVFDTDLVVRVHEMAEYVQHPYEVSDAGDVTLGEGIKVFMQFVAAPTPARGADRVRKALNSKLAGTDRAAAVARLRKLVDAAAAAGRAAYAAAETKYARGESLAARLNNLIDGIDRPRGDVIADMASAADISESAVRQILSGSIECPPEERLSAFAGVLNTSVGSLLSAARQDGCDYGE